MTLGTKSNSLKVNQKKIWDFTVSFEHVQLLVTRCPI